MLLEELFGNDTKENDTSEQTERRIEKNNVEPSLPGEEENPFTKKKWTR